MSVKTYPKYFDIHGHPNFAAYDGDRNEVIKRALDVGVWMNIVGTQKDTSRHAVELTEKYPEGVYATIGLHPIHTDKSFHDEEELGEGGREFTSRGEEFDYEYYRNLAKNPKVVAIGECGLDFYKHANSPIDTNHTNEKQEKVFRKQIELSIEVKKPLMLHLRSGSGLSAYKEAFRIISDYDLNLTAGNLHFFAGNLEEAEPFLEKGFYFSFGGVLTITRDYDEVLSKLPIDRILSETDCPYVAPTPYRGKRNEPAYVEEVVKKIADIKKMHLEEVKNILFRNALEFFGLKGSD